MESEDEGALVWRWLRQSNCGRATAQTPDTEACEQVVGELPDRESAPELQEVEEDESDQQITLDDHDQQEQQSEHSSDETANQHQENGDSDQEQGPSPLASHNHPQRERRWPRVLIFDALGQPTVREAGMDCIEVNKPAPCFQRL